MEGEYQSLENEGTVSDLVEVLKEFYPNAAPYSSAGFISLIGKHESWKIGTRLAGGLKIGFSYEFHPDKKKVNLTYQVSGGSIGRTLETEQSIRWQMFGGQTSKEDQG